MTRRLSGDDIHCGSQARHKWSGPAHDEIGAFEIHFPYSFVKLHYRAHTDLSSKIQ